MSDRTWTCWYWPKFLGEPRCPDIPAPYSRSSNDLNGIRSWAQGLAESGGVEWVKVFASSDEYDERFRWPARDA